MSESLTQRVPMEHFYKDEIFYPSWFTFPKLYSHVVQKYESGSHFVEVGTWKGSSASYMGVEIHNSGKTIRFDCVDTWNGTVNDPIHDADVDVMNKTLFEKFLSNTERIRQYLNPVRKDSIEASADYADGSLEFVFIDAEHTYDAVKKDVLAWLPKVKSGGILAGHDYAWCEDVRRGVHDALEISDNISDPWSEGCWMINVTK